MKQKIFLVVMSIIVVFQTAVLPASAYADDNIRFLTPNDKQIYTNIVNKANNQKRKILIDKVDFENITINQIKPNKHLKKQTLLYINSDEASNVLVQAPNGFNGSLRRMNMYTGIGLTKIGYQNYSQFFDNLKITYTDVDDNFIIIKPEILNFTYRYEERGKIKSDIHTFVDLTMMITVFDNNKEIFHKIYKANNIESYDNNHKTTNLVFSTLISTAMNNIYQKNIQDLSKIF
ncbi:MAG: hypothetical protein WCY19_03470 [Candidatus Gastranaerophilaceae bacterium]